MARPVRVSAVDDLRKQLDKDFGQLAIFGAAIVVVHLLNITPSEVSTLGAKFTIADPVILRGALAVLFLNKLHMVVLVARTSGGLYTTEDTNKAAGRSAIIRHRKLGRSPLLVKRFAKVDIFLWTLIGMPWAFLLLAFYGAALILSILDAYEFAGYCLSTKTALGRFIQSKF